ncbi:hypothetical protein RADP37_05484 (plasmid) [Roseomonas mucosa]|uniref:Uncharacterized protein n=1 Tax=Roseomonas mucosa TaxID=207340 RepID=A0A4Y1MS98_9PROT|nr:hypothetical protein RADP37_05484 [Roseomonas mucosa]
MRASRRCSGAEQVGDEGGPHGGQTGLRRWPALRRVNSSASPAPAEGWFSPAVLLGLYLLLPRGR